MTVFRQLALVGLLVALGYGAWTFVGPYLQSSENGGQKRSRDAAPAVVLSTVKLGSERIRVEAVGTARALNSARLHPAASGRVVAINFRTDQRVDRDQVLLQLDQEEEELAVELARVRLIDAERVMNRLQKLMKTGATAQASFDDARTALAEAQIELERAEVALADRVVIAPFAGRIGLTAVEVGDRIGQDTEIATLDDRSELLIRFEVAEALLGAIQLGDPVQVAPWSAGAQEVSGIVFDVGSRVSETSRTFVVRARIPNPDDRLRPGMSFRVTLDVVGSEFPKVPEIAIQWGGEGSYVWAVSEEGIARRVSVLIVQRQNAEVLVEGDLSPGERVVVEGLHRVREGSKLDILEAQQMVPPPIPARVEDVRS